jgi:glutaminyl-peptide cyclotransferase
MLNDYFCPMKFKWLSMLALCAVYMSSCNNTGPASGNSDDTSNSTNTPMISYSIAASYPHDTSSFTEGLEFYKGELIESGGNYGKSKLFSYDLTSGKSSRTIPLDSKYFGEGVTVVNDTAYQLTWKENVVMVYSAKDFRKVKEFPFNGEGWGLTNDGKNIIASNGTSNLFFYEPETFRLLKTQLITENGSSVLNINELEYINGYVYANQWGYPYIIKIDPNSGQVVGKLDLTELVNKVKAQDPKADFLNGIAYNPETKKFYVTGKYWPQIFELQLAL